MPLTHDFAANPFRFDAETGRGSQLLLHCILALSYKHINSDTGSCAGEAKMHKRKALQMLKDMEGVSQASPMEATFLDAVLILMTLDVSFLFGDASSLDNDISSARHRPMDLGHGISSVHIK